MSAIKVILYKQKTLANNEHPVMLYLFEEKVYRLSLGMSCSLEHWDEKKNRFRRSVPNYKSKNLTLSKYELQAKDILDDFVREGKYFDFDLFKKLFKGEKSAFFYEFYETMIDEKKKLGKHGTAATYQTALNQLRRYHRADIPFASVTYSFLKSVETFLLSNGCTGGGVSVYMRNVRAVYYEGIKRGLIDKDANPFSTAINKNGYSVAKLKSSISPKALTDAELGRLKAFDVARHPELADTYNMFMFSYYTYGVNFVDLCNLELGNVIEDRLSYVRQKTNGKFNLLVNAEARKILDQYRDNALETGYLFPVFNKNVHKTALQKRYRKIKIMKRTNDQLKEIGIRCDIATPLTFYVARHTAATTMKRKGVSTDVISEALGHKTLDITQHYLKKFDNNVLDEAMSVL